MTSAADPLQPTQEEFEAKFPCPNCGSREGKRWRTLRGRDVCDSCWLDTAMDEQAAHYRDAASDYKTRAQSASVPARRSNGQVLQGQKQQSPELGRARKQGSSLRSWARVDTLSSRAAGRTWEPLRDVRDRRASFGSPSQGKATDSSSPTIRAQQLSGTLCTMSYKGRSSWRAVADRLLEPSYNSICLLCGRIQYGVVVKECSRCRGLCVQRSDHDLGLMQRHPTTLTEERK